MRAVARRRARGRSPRSSAGTTSSRRWPTPAYFSRSASSSARVPEHTTRPARGASVSKSASQIQEMSRPSAMRSLRTIHTSSSPSPSAAASVRNTSFAPAGFLTSRIASLAVAEVDLLRAAERGRRTTRGPRLISSSVDPELRGSRRRPRSRCRRCRGRGGAARRSISPRGRGEREAASPTCRAAPRRRAATGGLRAARCRSSGTRSRRGGRGRRPSTCTRCRSGGSASRRRRARSAPARASGPRGRSR